MIDLSPDVYLKHVMKINDEKIIWWCFLNLALVIYFFFEIVTTLVLPTFQLCSPHNVWNSLKMPHLNFSILTFSTKIDWAHLGSPRDHTLTSPRNHTLTSPRPIIPSPHLEFLTLVFIASPHLDIHTLTSPRVFESCFHTLTSPRHSYPHLT